MKLKIIVFTATLCFVASFPISARKNPARFFFLPTPVTVEGAQIPQGMYQLIVESSNSGVRVNWWREGQFVASASGAWVRSGMKYSENTVLLRVNSDGSRSLIEIRLAGSAKAIVLKNTDPIVRYSEK
jgi:hypothetical protein